MDPFRLLARSTRFSKKGSRQDVATSPAKYDPPIDQISGETNGSVVTKKRKRTVDGVEAVKPQVGAHRQKLGDNSEVGVLSVDKAVKSTDAEHGLAGEDVDLGHVKRLMKEHNLKVVCLNHTSAGNGIRKATRRKTGVAHKNIQLFPQPLRNLSELRTRFSVAPSVARNLEQEGFSIPTEVQMAALPLLLEEPSSVLESDAASSSGTGIDLLTVAPTGSGKTLAFLVPLLHHIYRAKGQQSSEDKSTVAFILAPTKELAFQIVNEGRTMARGTGIRISQVRKGMFLKSPRAVTPDSIESDEDSAPTGLQPAVKSDILVSTPGVLAAVVKDAVAEDTDTLSSIRHLILDEADVLLDPLFRAQTLSIWKALPNPELRVSLWSATMGSNIEELSQSIIKERLQGLTLQSGHAQPEAPLIRLVVGLKDSAASNVHHKLVYAASEQGKLTGLRQLLHPSTTSRDDTTPRLIPPFLVFTQSIERAVALHAELRYDIPAEAGGGEARIAVLHADLSDAARGAVMARFRRGEIWVLITTDLLARGVDFRGVNGVVNYDLPTSSAAYVHRVGRTGRAGRAGGVAVTLYSKEDIPYLKPIVNVVAAAQKQQNGESGKGASDGVQRWLLDALPALSKDTKQKLKRRGIESRTARGMREDPKAARKARISTKAGFVRRKENNRKGAIEGSKRRQRQMQAQEESGDETDFGGFD